MSPAQIRRQAMNAWRHNVQLSHENAPKWLRQPMQGETPLSPAEVRFAVDRGLALPPLRLSH